mgnify:FL=1
MTELETNEKTFSIVSPPAAVGGYRFGNEKNYYIQFNLNHKPKWLHRQCMRIFFGMYWYDGIK